MSIYTIGDLNLYGEICCEACNEIIHCHFDCPACGQKNADTSMCGDYYEYHEDGEQFECEECGAAFVPVAGDGLRWEMKA